MHAAYQCDCKHSKLDITYHLFTAKKLDACKKVSQQHRQIIHVDWPLTGMYNDVVGGVRSEFDEAAPIFVDAVDPVIWWVERVVDSLVQPVIWNSCDNTPIYKHNMRSLKFHPQVGPYNRTFHMSWVQNMNKRTNTSNMTEPYIASTCIYQTELIVFWFFLSLITKE